jgi:predicted nucleotidyltransferase
MDKKKESEKDFPTLNLMDEREIAIDFAAKIYEKFNKLIKSVILFGSHTKNTSTSSSDIDIIVIIDDATLKIDQEFAAWYREELGRIIATNPYKKDLHINTVKLTTWWQDLMRGDPVIINIIRFGDALIDFGGFFNPLKILLQEGKIKSTPEAIYNCLQRAPAHLARSRASQLGTVEGLYWAMVDSSQAALMAARQIPPSPEHIPIMLKEMFVDTNNLKMKYVVWCRDLYLLHRKIMHGDINEFKGQDIDEWRRRTEEFLSVMVNLVKRLIS